MADDEIMIEDDAIALEDTDDTTVEDIEVSNIIPFIMERYQRAEDYRYQDEERWLRSYRNYRGLYGPDVQFTEEPRLVFFSSCTNTISQIPAIPLDKKNPEDVDTKSEDHLYDALRYGIMSRPRFSIFDYDPHGRPSTGMPVADSTFGY